MPVPDPTAIDTLPLEAAGQIHIPSNNPLYLDLNSDIVGIMYRGSCKLFGAVQSQATFAKARVSHPGTVQ